MKLRAFALILTLALGLLATPVPVEAQQAGKVYRIGYLGPTFPRLMKLIKVEFLEELRDLGWVEGKNFVMEYRSPEGRYERLPALAAELVQLKVDLIVTFLTVSTRAAKNTTTTIPIVFLPISDPVESGLVASLARPGGNLTGLTHRLPELSGKALELLTEAVPGISRVAVLWNPGPTVRPNFKGTQAAAQALGVTLQSVEVRGPGDFESAFSAMIRERADALVVLVGPLVAKNRTRIADLAVTHRLPTTADSGTLARAGALMAYGPSWPAMVRRAAHYVDKILKGANPADLPVEQPTKFEFVINLKTAKALGLTIPPSVLVRADRVIR